MTIYDGDGRGSDKVRCTIIALNVAGVALLALSAVLPLDFARAVEGVLGGVS
jgi:hypothetical protein